MDFHRRRSLSLNLGADRRPLLIMDVALGRSFLLRQMEDQTRATAISVHHADGGVGVGELSGFRREFHGSLTRRADALFELADAVLCADGPPRLIAELSLVGEHRRGHGIGYAALTEGRMDIDRLRCTPAAMPVPRAADGRLVLAVDVTCWLRPEAHTSPQRILCHTYGRGKDTHITVPGRPYSVIVALETGRSSWTARSTRSG